MLVLKLATFKEPPAATRDACGAGGSVGSPALTVVARDLQCIKGVRDMLGKYMRLLQNLWSMHIPKILMPPRKVTHKQRVMLQEGAHFHNG